MEKMQITRAFGGDTKLHTNYTLFSL